MTLTINTDASFSRRINRGTFAFWIVCDQGRFSQSGALKDACARPEEAEFKCIINAVHAAGAMKLQGVTRIIINTDCLNVIHLISNDSANIQKYRLLEWSKGLVKKFNQTVKSAGLSTAAIELRHVRSHSGTSTKRQWVNEWCDQAAKKAINELINEQRTG